MMDTAGTGSDVGRVGGELELVRLVGAVVGEEPVGGDGQGRELVNFW